MQHRDERLKRSRAEAGLKAFDGLGRERNFRNQNNRTLSLLEGVSDGLQVDFGFTGACDAFEQKCSGCSSRSSSCTLPGSAI